MKKEVVSKEVAAKEIIEFLTENDALSMIPTDEADKAQDAKRASFDKLVSDMVAGRLYIKDGVITKVLKYPVPNSDKEIILTEVKFGNRLLTARRNAILGKLKENDQRSALSAFLELTSELTGVSEGVLGKIDSADFKVIDIITGSFLA